ncbi:MAG: SDR family oxidoreductase [Eubacteriales bacterium]|nr:SDR family oxidoreductase [Eubacteriales bacterium]MDD4717880.1 SDR family oxidoreductase [Eubacteriales bacterium]
MRQWIFWKKYLKEMNDRTDEKPVVIITGASAGIGLAAAEKFMSEGYIVYGINRRIPEQAGGINYFSADVACGDSVRAAIDSIWAVEKRIDILINNAGSGISGAVEFAKEEDVAVQMNVNFGGTLNCVKAVLPYMREQRSGIIINISSVAGVIPIPFQAFYSASKAAVNSITLALANELRPFGIRVCALMPGDVRTEFTASREKNTDGSDVYSALTASVSTMEKDERNGMTPGYVAGKIYRIAKKRHPKPLCTVGVSYKVLVVLNKLLPARVVNKIVGAIYANYKI